MVARIQLGIDLGRLSTLEHYVLLLFGVMTMRRAYDGLLYPHIFKNYVKSVPFRGDDDNRPIGVRFCSAL